MKSVVVYINLLVLLSIQSTDLEFWDYGLFRHLSHDEINFFYWGEFYD